MNQAMPEPASHAAGVGVTARALTRRFGNHLAVDRVDLQIAPGARFSLLGANGAGKTTFIRMLTGFLLPTSGELMLDGISPARHPHTANKHIGFSMETACLYPELRVSALRRYLETGGGLVALIEPGHQTGLEELLSEYGLSSPDAVIIDPDSGTRDARTDGIDPIASHYNTHAIIRGLDANRVTFFRGARSFELRKAEPDDRIQGIVLASPQSWLSEDLSLLDRRSGHPDPGPARRDYHPLVVSGRYQREAGETRIVAFGDSDFCSNRDLRAVYNLDLILNAIHWATQREPEITIRPKAVPPSQFPLPIANSLQTFYGVGLLIPELLLIAGGLIWLRTKNK